MWASIWAHTVSWGVLHTQLVKEAIVSLEPTTLLTTVKGNSVAIITKKWQKQYQQVFHLQSAELRSVTNEWTLAELFPSLKDNAKAVRISDCR